MPSSRRTRSNVSNVTSTQALKRQRIAGSTSEIKTHPNSSIETHRPNDDDVQYSSNEEGEEEGSQEMDGEDDHENDEAKYICPFSRPRQGVKYLCDEFGDKGRKTKAAVHSYFYHGH